MVQYGVVWYGVVWYGMAWYGMIWYGVVLYRVILHGMVIRFTEAKNPYLAFASPTYYILNDWFGRLI